MQVNTGFIKCIVAYYGKIEFSLDNLIEEDLPKIFIAMAQYDEMFPLNCNEPFIQYAKNKGFEVEDMIHSKGKHGFDAFNDDEETRIIINKTIDFINKSLEK